MRRDAIAVPLVSAVVAALLWLALGTIRELPESSPGWAGDFLHFYLPNAEYAGARMARGEIPLWNPHQGAGGPFLATLQAGVLYPPNWLHALLPAATAFVVLAVLHLILGVLLTSGLASALGAGAYGAAAAGVAYATSFNVAGTVWTPPVLYATCWAPGILWAVDRVIAAPSSRRMVALAVTVAMAILTGWPYVVAMTALAAALFGTALLLGSAVRDRRLPLRALSMLVLGVAAGLALAAPQILPSAELLGRSVRALGSLVEGQAVWVPEPHDPVRWFKFFLRNSFNDAVPGLAALALTPLAFVLPGPGRLRLAVLLAVGGIGLLLSFPYHTPVFGWLRELPVFGDFRFPYRYRLLANLAMAIGAGVGADHLQRWFQARPRVSRTAGVLAVAACLLTTLIPATTAIRPYARNVTRPVGVSAELEQLGVVREVGEFARTYWFGRSEKLGEVENLYTVHDLEPITLASTAQIVTYFETGRALTLATVDKSKRNAAQHESLAAPFYGFLTLPDTGERAPLLDLFSVRWIVSPLPLAWLEERYQRISPVGSEPSAYENPLALPHAYRVPWANRQPEKLNEALRRLASPKFPHRRIVMLEPAPASLLPRDRKPARKSSGSVTVEVYEPERVVMRTAGPQPAAVVLTDAFFPGWEATLDGEPVPLLRANVGFRAVAVPAGEHEIEMRYAPASFRWGLILAALSAAGCLIAMRRPPGAAVVL